MIKNFRDLLAIIVFAIIFPAMWILHGLGIICLPGEVLGATISIETLIGQFYFRKATRKEAEL